MAMSDRWSNTSIALHWFGAVLILALAGAGFVMTDLAPASGGRLLLSRAHTLGGATLMLLTLARLFVRWRSPRVAPLPISEIHRRGVGAVHAFLYATVFSVGLSGFVTGARSSWPEYLRGHLGQAPDLEDLASLEVHEALAITMLWGVALHVGGVVVQQFRQGGILERMLPPRK